MRSRELILCDMFASRVAVAAIAAGVFLCACGGPSDRDLHRQLKLAGCAMPESQYQRLPDRVVLSISVVGCAVSDGYGGSRLLTSTEAMTVVARTAWSALTYRFDTLLVTDYSVATVDGRIGSPLSEEIAREALAEEFGQRDSGLDTSPPTSFLDDRGTAFPWVVIPPLALTLGLGLFVALVRAIRRGSISFFWVVR